MNTDPEVMRWFHAPLSRAESDAMAGRIAAHIHASGWGLWAVEVPGRVSFAGFVGLSTPSFEASFNPCIEVGWRLARHAWGFGYATEAAEAAIEDGAERLGFTNFVSFTSRGNMRSRAVMERIGMVHAPSEDFMHPSLPQKHPLAPHVLYRLG